MVLGAFGKVTLRGYQHHMFFFRNSSGTQKFHPHGSGVLAQHENLRQKHTYHYPLIKTTKSALLIILRDGRCGMKLFMVV